MKWTYSKKYHSWHIYDLDDEEMREAWQWCFTHYTKGMQLKKKSNIVYYEMTFSHRSMLFEFILLNKNWIDEMKERYGDE